MIISIGGSGRLGNNILLAADLSALALEYDVRLEILGLRALVPDLESHALARVRLHGPHDRLPLAVQPFCHPTVANALRRATKFCSVALPLMRVVGDRGGGPSIGDLVHLARRTRVVYAGWNFRAQDLLVRHQSQIRALMRLRPALTAGVEQRLLALRRTGKRILGIHIRRGDYRSWAGGRFHYDDPTYQRLATEFLHASGEDFHDPGILLVSDEPTTWPLELGGVPVMRFSGTVVEDLAALSLCDRILGPPSTFAMSASLIGCVPYLQVADPSEPVRVDRCFTYGSEVFPDHARIEYLLNK